MVINHSRCFVRQLAFLSATQHGSPVVFNSILSATLLRITGIFGEWFTWEESRPLQPYPERVHADIYRKIMECAVVFFESKATSKRSF